VILCGAMQRLVYAETDMAPSPSPPFDGPCFEEPPPLGTGRKDKEPLEPRIESEEKEPPGLCQAMVIDMGNPAVENPSSSSMFFPLKSSFIYDIYDNYNQIFHCHV